MDIMNMTQSKPGSSLARTLLAVALLAAAFGASPRPALAEEPAKIDAEGREQMEQKLKVAQERMEQDAREMAELSLSLNGDHDAIDHRVKLIVMERPTLGMSIDMKSGSTDAGAGVRVVSVSPGGPAELAGIRANDLIVSLSGTPLHADAQHSAPQQLHSIMKAAKSGEPLAIEYRRDGKAYKAQIVPKDSMLSHQDLNLPPLPEILALEDHEGNAMTRVMHLGLHDSSGFGAAEMVDLSPALGSYFGTDKGLLIVRAPRDQRLKLQDGDVLIDVDGRVPGSVAHALQILASYRSGETVHLHILRQKQRLELSVEVPEA
jgi:S1-C subfamily serine protease